MVQLVKTKGAAIPSLKLFVLIGFTWAAIAGPIYSVLILKYIGASSSQIGIFTAICAVIGMMCQPVWGYLSDKIGSPRKVMCLCLAVSSVFFVLLLLTRNFYIAAGLLIIEIIFRCCIISLMDSHTLSEINVIPGLQYSHIRVAGSIFYGTLSFVYSRTIDSWGVMSIIPISFLVSTTAVLWGLFIAKDSSQTGLKDIHRIKPDLKKEALALLKSYQNIIFLLIIAFSSLAVLPLNTFIIYYTEVIGGSSGDAAFIPAIRCVFELIFFILLAIFSKKFSTKALLIIGACLSFIYVTGVLFAANLFWLTFWHSVGAAGFVISLTGRMRYVKERISESVRSTFITLMGASEIALGAVAGNLIAGFVLGRYGTYILTLTAVGSMVVALILLGFVRQERAAS